MSIKSINIQNLGPIIEQRAVEFSKITLIVGENNLGKTYITHTIFGILKILKNYLNMGNLEMTEIDKGQFEIILPEFDDKIMQDSVELFLKKSGDEIFGIGGSKIYEKTILNIDFDITKKINEIFIDKSIDVYGTEIAIKKEIGKLNIMLFNNDLSSKKFQKESWIKERIIDRVQKIIISEICNSMMDDCFILTAERGGVNIINEYKNANQKLNQQLHESSENQISLAKIFIINIFADLINEEHYYEIKKTEQMVFFHYRLNDFSRHLEGLLDFFMENKEIEKNKILDEIKILLNRIFSKMIGRNIIIEDNIVANNIKKLSLLRKAFPENIREKRNFLKYSNRINIGLALQQNIEIFENIKDIAKNDSFIMNNKNNGNIYSQIINKFTEICGGLYILDKDSGGISFLPDGSKGHINLEATSSTVKSLILLKIFIFHTAKEGDMLIIDEPELNLHPSNQIKLAQLFAMLANIGIKIFCTTHSDYIVREFNNLIRIKDINNNLPNKNSKLYKEIINDELLSLYTPSQLIDSGDLSINIIYRENELIKIKKAETIDEYNGYVTDSFDNVIIKGNKIENRALYYSDKIASRKK